MTLKVILINKKINVMKIICVKVKPSTGLFVLFLGLSRETIFGRLTLFYTPIRNWFRALLSLKHSAPSLTNNNLLPRELL